MKNTFNYFLIFTFAVTILFSCKEDDNINNDSKTVIIKLSSNAAAEAQEAFIEAEDGTTFIFEEGNYDFLNSLSMSEKNDIVIKGSGRTLTTLNFANQAAGAEGIIITDCNNLRIEGLTVSDAIGDAIKVRDCNTVSFVDVGTVWTGEPSEDNGAYGLYPVLCTKVYIDNCYAYGASDAGIYVGQSDQIILKNSVAEGNVAGIEIENSTNADVFDNEAFDNTGGILVFDLPGLTQYGSKVRVFNNNSHDNNRINFAPAGNIVSNVPAGTGCMILSTKEVEIFDNNFEENTFAGVLIASYLAINDNITDPNFGPFPKDIYLHDNSYSTTGSVNVNNQPEFIQDIIGLLTANSIDQPDVFTDGVLISKSDICIKESNIDFVSLNAWEDDSFESLYTSLDEHDCSKPSLPSVSFEPF